MVFALVAVLALLVWAVPVVLVIALGGFAIAMVLSFPVHLFSRVMPRSLAIFLLDYPSLGIVLAPEDKATLRRFLAKADSMR